MPPVESIWILQLASDGAAGNTVVPGGYRDDPKTCQVNSMSIKKEAKAS
jgi:hypothetical protein